MTAAVVVPVRGGDRGTWANLRAIGSAAARAGVHVLLVDNGMRPHVRAAADRSGLQVLECATVGSYAARNVGVAAALAAGHDVILFTDADCRPCGDWPGHLLAVLATADVVTTVAAPRAGSFLAAGARADYRRRLAEWAGADLRCGSPINTMDTRAAAVRAAVFGSGPFSCGSFDTRLRFAGDAAFGRSARRAGASVVGCHHPVLSHDPPDSWAGELSKHRRIAASLVDDLRAVPRLDVLRLLPEHAHLLLPPPPDLLARSHERYHAALRDCGPADPASALNLYRAVRELGWHLGWTQGHRNRQIEKEMIE